VPVSGAASARRLALACAVALVSACATRAPHGLADRFVTRAEGESPADAATFDVDPKAAEATRNAAVTRPPVPVVPIPKVSPGPTLESQNASLRSALAALAVRESVDAHRRAAAEYWREKVFDQAEHHLSQAIVLRPRDAGLFEERARLWRDAGVLDRALADAHYAAYLAPDRAEAQSTLGTVLFALGRVKAARERFARAVARAPDAAYALKNLCFAALTDGALDQAKTACDAAIRLAPGLDAAKRNRTRVEAALGARRPSSD
jgi:Tfp pilus assembly protein PilF